jgi:hypothetical protein
VRDSPHRTRARRCRFLAEARQSCPLSDNVLLRVSGRNLPVREPRVCGAGAPAAIGRPKPAGARGGVEPNGGAHRPRIDA